MKSIIYEYIDKDKNYQTAIGSEKFFTNDIKNNTCVQLVRYIGLDHSKEDREYYESLTEDELLFALTQFMNNNLDKTFYPISVAISIKINIYYIPLCISIRNRFSAMYFVGDFFYVIKKLPKEDSRQLCTIHDQKTIKDLDYLQLKIEIQNCVWIDQQNQKRSGKT